MIAALSVDISFGLEGELAIELDVASAIVHATDLGGIVGLAAK